MNKRYKLEIWDYLMKLSHNGKDQKYVLHHPEKNISIVSKQVTDMKIKSCLSICRDKGFDVQRDAYRRRGEVGVVYGGIQKSQLSPTDRHQHSSPDASWYPDFFVSLTHPKRGSISSSAEVVAK